MTDDENLPEEARDAILRAIVKGAPDASWTGLRDLAEAYTLVTGGKSPKAASAPVWEGRS